MTPNSRAMSLPETLESSAGLPTDTKGQGALWSPTSCHDVPNHFDGRVTACLRLQKTAVPFPLPPGEHSRGLPLPLLAGLRVPQRQWRAELVPSHLSPPRHPQGQDRMNPSDSPGEELWLHQIPKSKARFLQPLKEGRSHSAAYLLLPSSDPRGQCCGPLQISKGIFLLLTLPHPPPPDLEGRSGRPRLRTFARGSGL